MRTITRVDQILAEVRIALRGIGRHGRVTLVVEAIDDGTLVYRMEHSRLTEEDLQRLMQERPRGWRR